MRKILIVEDDKVLSRCTAEFLEMEGYIVVQAENGLQAIKLAVEELPDLILCDIVLPELDGYQVCNNLQHNPSTELTPFIFLSGKTDQKDIRTGMHLGADDYITKPFALEELITAIETRLVKYDKFMNKTYENFQALMENPIFGIFILQDDQIVFHNRKFSDTIGFNRNDLKDMNFSELIHPQDSDTLHLKMDQTIRGLRRKFHTEIRILNSWQNYITVEISGGLTRVNNQKAILFVIGLQREVQDSTQVMDHLEEVNKSLSLIIDKKDSVPDGMAKKIVEVFDRSLESQKFENKEGLTKREKEILGFICRGMTNQEIADVLSLSTKTIDSHRTHLLEKTNSRNTADLVIYAIKNQIVKLD